MGKDSSFAVICIKTGTMDGWYFNKKTGIAMVKHCQKNNKKFKEPRLLSLYQSNRLYFPITDGMFHAIDKKPKGVEKVLVALYIEIAKLQNGEK